MKPTQHNITSPLPGPHENCPMPIPPNSGTPGVQYIYLQKYIRPGLLHRGSMPSPPHNTRAQLVTCLPDPTRSRGRARPGLELEPVTGRSLGRGWAGDGTGSGWR